MKIIATSYPNTQKPYFKGKLDSDSLQTPVTKRDIYLHEARIDNNIDEKIKQQNNAIGHSLLALAEILSNPDNPQVISRGIDRINDNLICDGYFKHNP